MKKIETPFLLLASALILTGCRAGQDVKDETKTNISVVVFDGTARTEYMDNCAKRFEEAHANDSFEAGKTGVHIDVKSAADVPNDKKSLTTAGEDIFLSENKPDIYNNAHEGTLMDISDVVQPLVNNIDADALNGCIGADSKYYALPHYSWYTGLTYNKNIFDDNLLYFADPSETNAKVPTAASSFYGYNDVKVVKSLTAKKSVGPDGIAGTEDDGLPSSLQEFVIWCAYTQSLDVHPFRMAGKQPTYCMYITHGIWSALAGAEKMKAFYQNYTTTPIEVVKKDSDNKTILSNKELFYSGSRIYAPETEKIVINESNGNRVYDMVERYYSIAFLKLIYDQGWLFMNGSNDSHLYAMNDFINGSQVQTDLRSAILCDASYWYHEAKTYVAEYKKGSSGIAPNLSYMPLPVTLEGSVTEKGAGESANKQTLMNVGSSYLYVNAKTASDAGRKSAVTSFLNFMYSDSELKAFSELTGLQIPMKYSYSTDNQDTYYQKLSNIVKDANVVQFASSSTLFKLNKSTFTLYYNSRLTELTIGSESYPSQSYIGPLKDTKKNYSTADLFDAGGMKKSIWDGLKRTF